MISTLILLALLFIELGMHLAKHGEVKEKAYNFWHSLIAAAIILSLYYHAGIFENFK